MVVMITGASRGIGFETVKYFARMKHVQVFALSRNKAGLGQLATECAGLNKFSQVHPLVLDLDEFLEKPEALLKRLPVGIRHIDILINNAGLLVNKPFLETSLEEIQQIFRINCFAPAMLIRQLMPFMGGTKPPISLTSAVWEVFREARNFPDLLFTVPAKQHWPV